MLKSARFYRHKYIFKHFQKSKHQIIYSTAKKYLQIHIFTFSPYLLSFGRWGGHLVPLVIDHGCSAPGRPHNPPAADTLSFQKIVQRDSQLHVTAASTAVNLLRQLFLMQWALAQDTNTFLRTYYTKLHQTMD